MTDRYAVIGHPVAQSRSPWIHAQFAGQLRMDMDYSRIDCPPEEAERTMRSFFAGGGSGLNVTAPHKQAAFLIADRIGMRARIAGAVNTLTREDDGQLTGDNTDGTGLVRDLVQNLGVAVTGSRVLLLGAGGAARGVVAPLLGQKVARLTIANRTHEKALALAETFAGFGPVDARRPDRLTPGFDVIINATAAGLRGGVPGGVPDIDAAIVEGSCCYDLTYGDGGLTSFVTWAGENGAREIHDGWGMLVEQAAESFYLWRGTWPQTGPVIAARPF